LAFVAVRWVGGLGWIRRFPVGPVSHKRLGDVDSCGVLLESVYTCEAGLEMCALAHGGALESS